LLSTLTTCPGQYWTFNTKSLTLDFLNHTADKCVHLYTQPGRLHEEWWESHASEASGDEFRVIRHYAEYESIGLVRGTLRLGTDSRGLCGLYE